MIRWLFWLLGELQFLAPYKHVILPRYLWVIVGSDPGTVMRATVALLISVPLYPFFIRSMAPSTTTR